MKKFTKSRMMLIIVLGVFASFWATSVSAWDWPKDLTIGTQGIGTASYAQTVGWGSVLEEKTGMKVRVRPTNSYAEKSRAHKAGHILLTNNTITEFVTIMEANGVHATRTGGPYETGIIWIGQSVYFGFMTLKNSEIKSVYDLKKKKWKISVFTPSTPSVNHVKGLLSWAGVDEKNIILVPATSWSANAKSIVEGRADITFCAPTSTVAHEIEANPKGVRWLDFPDNEKDGQQKYMNINRGIGFARNGNKGVKSAHNVYMASNVTYYHTPLNTDTEFVYNMAKWLDENYDIFKDKHKACEDMTMDKLLSFLDNGSSNYYFPVHSGTVKYLKEKGKWSAKDDKWNEKNKKHIKKLIEAYKFAIADADKKKIKIDAKAEDWKALWADHLKDLKLLGTLQN